MIISGSSKEGLDLFFGIIIKYFRSSVLYSKLDTLFKMDEKADVTPLLKSIVPVIKSNEGQIISHSDHQLSAESLAEIVDLFEKKTLSDLEFFPADVWEQAKVNQREAFQWVKPNTYRSELNNFVNADILPETDAMKSSTSIVTTDSQPFALLINLLRSIEALDPRKNTSDEEFERQIEDTECFLTLCDEQAKSTQTESLLKTLKELAHGKLAAIYDQYALWCIQKIKRPEEDQKSISVSESIDHKKKLVKIITYYLKATEEIAKGPIDPDFKATAENEDPHFENKARYYEHIIFYLTELHDVNLSTSEPFALEDIPDFDLTLDQLHLRIIRKFGHRFKWEDFNFTTLVGLYNTHKRYCEGYATTDFNMSVNAELNKFFLHIFEKYMEKNDPSLFSAVAMYAACLAHAFNYLGQQTSVKPVLVVSSQLQAQCDEQQGMLSIIDRFNSKLEECYLSKPWLFQETYKNFHVQIADTCLLLSNHYLKQAKKFRAVECMDVSDDKFFPVEACLTHSGDSLAPALSYFKKLISYFPDDQKINNLYCLLVRKYYLLKTSGFVNTEKFDLKVSVLLLQGIIGMAVDSFQSSTHFPVERLLNKVIDTMGDIPRENKFQKVECILRELYAIKIFDPYDQVVDRRIAERMNISYQRCITFINAERRSLSLQGSSVTLFIAKPSIEEVKRSDNGPSKTEPRP